MRKMLVIGLGVLLTAIICTAANAGDTSDQGDWKFNLAPFYLWAVSMDGEMTTGTSTTPVVADFKELASSLETIFTVHFEGMHKTGWGLLIDVNYLDLGGQQTVSSPVPASLDIDFTSVMAEFAGIYRFSFGENTFDVIAGTRYISLEPEINITSPAPLPGRIDKKQDWWDVMIGGRYNWIINEKWSFDARGDVGLFGSDLTLNAAGLFKFQPWKHVSLLAGYRYMDIDYEEGSGADLFKYDMTMHGPLLGVNFVW
jgi:hypothetical protein